MDPAGLLISIATIAHTLEELSGSYSGTSDTLSTLKTQIKILETGTQRIQEWLHFTDPGSQMKVHGSLRDAVATVDSSLRRLHEDLTSLQSTSGQPLDGRGHGRDAKAKFAYNESRMQRHLTDVRECSSLMHFTLNVCQLPSDSGADQEVHELEMGAKALQRAQTSARDQRQALVQETLKNGSAQRSEDYGTFMKQVMDAEMELPEDEPSRRTSILPPAPLTRLASAESAMTAESAIPSPLNPAERHPRSHYSPPMVRKPTRPVVQTPLPDEPDFFDDHVGMAMSTPASEATPAPQSAHSDDYFHSRPVTPQSMAPVIKDDKEIASVVSPAPTVPQRHPERRTVYAGSDTAPATRPMRRKSPSRTSTSGSLSSASYLGPAASSSTARATPSTERSTPDRGLTDSPVDSGYSLSEKVRPPSQRLSSMRLQEDASDRVASPSVRSSIESIPMYASFSANIPSRPQARPRKNTAKSSLVDETSPGIVTLAREARVVEIENSIKQGADINEADPRTGCTALMEASRSRLAATARLLIQLGAQVQARDVDGNTALHLAAIQGDEQACQILLGAGAAAEDHNQRGFTPLELAARNGHTEAVLCLIKGSRAGVERENNLVKGFFEGVRSGDVPTAQAFITSGGVNPRNIKESWKPTAFAAQSGSLPMLNLMLMQKCSLKDRNPAGWTPLHHAARYDQTSMVHKLLDLKVPWKTQTKKAEETALHIAAAHGNTSAAVALAAHKDANVKIRDVDDLEPIHHAFRHGDVRLTAALLERGAKLNGTTKYGWKPVHLAAAYGHESLLAECITRGVSVEEKLMTPAFKPEKRTNAAARRGYWGEIRWPHSGARPLHLALEFGHTDVARVLIAGGVKIDEGDSRAWRPLHYATFGCLPEMIDLLLRRGATVDAKTIDGHSALTLGFREYGLNADQSLRMKAVKLLEAAFASQTGSRPPAGFNTNGPSTSRTAAQRNQYWHTAQMAEAIYLSKPSSSDDDIQSYESSSVGTGSGSIASDEQMLINRAQSTSSASIKT
ncbi:hypothetical protein KC363_g1673 [Hortaea werneckii]|uniref:Uncharacterized protein n=1 Tax=Hortaea werneckii TaxID=91943 RepID=A0A3M7G4K1_HORWE|nr:hypothetical protein KC363_g1673 [Hortaea werneckii]RMY96068.1 hypothetical protein D0861_00253 [Hortaea werneckii]